MSVYHRTSIVSAHSISELPELYSKILENGSTYHFFQEIFQGYGRLFPGGRLLPFFEKNRMVVYLGVVAYSF